MTELLKRWASLEPTWCRVDDERAGVMTDVGAPLERLRFEAQFHRLGQYEPLILASVIEAVTAREWEITLEILGGCIATVTRDPDNWAHDNIHVEARDTPAAALLGAYLAALEGEAEK